MPLPDYVDSLAFGSVIEEEFGIHTDPGHRRTLGRIGLEALRHNQAFTAGTDVSYSPEWAPVTVIAKTHELGTTGLSLHALTIIDRTDPDRQINPAYAGQFEVIDKGSKVRVRLAVGTLERSEILPLNTEDEIRAARILTTGAATIFFGSRLSSLYLPETY